MLNDLADSRNSSTLSVGLFLHCHDWVYQPGISDQVVQGGVMLINDDPFRIAIQEYRICWISGRTGGYKTSLCYELARPYLDKGYGLISNNTSVWADDDYSLDANGQLKKVVILDEGGRWLKVGIQTELIASYIAKMDYFVLIPSRWPPARNARVLTCQALYTFRGVGLHVVVYKWTLHMDEMKDSGYMVWTSPQQYYGIYSRQDPGIAGPMVMENLASSIQCFIAMWEKKGGLTHDSISKLAKVSEITDNQIMADAAEGIYESSNLLISVPARRGGFSRR